MSRADDLLTLAAGVRGFMPEEEGRALYELARSRARAGGTWLELGAWCGKSTVYLGAAAEAAGALLYSLDHHRGSEETQAGWEHFDPAVADESGRIDTLPHWRATIARARLEGCVVGLVGESVAVAAHFDQRLDLLFLDGGHGEAVAWADWRAWSPKVAPGGLLLIHDVFPDPADGGRPPYEVFCAARAEGFAEVAAVGSLRALTR